MANERFESIWDALAGTPDEAVDLKERSELMLQITKQIKSRVWRLEEALKLFSAPQHVIQSLLDGHLSKSNLSAFKAIAKAMHSQ